MTCKESYSRDSVKWSDILLGLAMLTFLASPLLSSTERQDFSNMQGTVSCRGVEVFAPSTEDDVILLMQRAVRQDRKVQAASSKWRGSNESSCADHRGIQIDTRGMNKILAVDEAAQTITVQPGINLWDMNLWAHELYRLTLPVVQEYADVSIGGMIGNGTHGSSLQAFSSSIQDRILMVRLVDGEGQLREISGKDLDYLANNLGVLGVLTAVTLKMDPSFKVRATVLKQDDFDLAATILERASAHYSVSITWFPKQKSYLITNFDKVPNVTPGEAHNGQTEAAWWQRATFPAMFKSAHLGRGNKLSCFLEKQRMDMKAKGYFTDKTAKQADSAVGWSHEMTSFVCRDRCPFKNLPFMLQEIAISLDSLPDFIEQAQRLFDITGACLPLNGIYFRFGRATRGAIGLAAGRDTVYIGMEYVENPWGNRYPKDFHVIQELEQILLKDFGGRPHWGKNRQAIFHRISEQYPRWQDFTDYRDQLDPQRRMVNPFFDYISSLDQEAAVGKNCVVDASCFCTANEHCPKNFHCQSGFLDSDTRVCIAK